MSYRGNANFFRNNQRDLKNVGGAQNQRFQPRYNAPQSQAQNAYGGGQQQSGGYHTPGSYQGYQQPNTHPTSTQNQQNTYQNTQTNQYQYKQQTTYNTQDQNKSQYGTGTWSANQYTNQSGTNYQGNYQSSVQNIKNTLGSVFGSPQGAGTPSNTIPQNQGKGQTSHHSYQGGTNSSVNQNYQPAQTNKNNQYDNRYSTSYPRAPYNQSSQSHDSSYASHDNSSYAKYEHPTKGYEQDTQTNKYERKRERDQTSESTASKRSKDSQGYYSHDVDTHEASRTDDVNKDPYNDPERQELVEEVSGGSAKHQMKLIKQIGIQDCFEDRNIDPWRCYFCTYKGEGWHEYINHCIGKKHKQRLTWMSSSVGVALREKFREELFLLPFLSSQRGKGKDTSSSKHSVVNDQQDGYSCKTCSAQFPTFDDLKDHFDSYKHKDRVDLLKKKFGHEWEDFHWYTSKAKGADASREEPVGLSFIVPVSGFFCKICSTFYNSEASAKNVHCRQESHASKVENWNKQGHHMDASYALKDGDKVGAAGGNSGSEKSSGAIVIYSDCSSDEDMEGKRFWRPSASSTGSTAIPGLGGEERPKSSRRSKDRGRSSRDRDRKGDRRSDWKEDDKAKEELKIKEEKLRKRDEELKKLRERYDDMKKKQIKSEEDLMSQQKKTADRYEKLLQDLEKKSRELQERERKKEKERKDLEKIRIELEQSLKEEKVKREQDRKREEMRAVELKTSIDALRAEQEQRDKIFKEREKKEKELKENEERIWKQRQQELMEKEQQLIQRELKEKERREKERREKEEFARQEMRRKEMERVEEERKRLELAEKEKQLRDVERQEYERIRAEKQQIDNEAKRLEQQRIEVERLQTEKLNMIEQEKRKVEENLKREIERKERELQEKERKLKADLERKAKELHKNRSSSASRTDRDKDRSERRGGSKGDSARDRGKGRDDSRQRGKHSSDRHDRGRDSDRSVEARTWDTSGHGVEEGGSGHNNAKRAQDLINQLNGEQWMTDLFLIDEQFLELNNLQMTPDLRERESSRLLREKNDVLQNIFNERKKIEEEIFQEKFLERKAHKQLLIEEEKLTKIEVRRKELFGRGLSEVDVRMVLERDIETRELEEKQYIDNWTMKEYADRAESEFERGEMLKEQIHREYQKWKDEYIRVRREEQEIQQKEEEEREIKERERELLELRERELLERRKMDEMEYNRQEQHAMPENLEGLRDVVSFQEYEDETNFRQVIEVERHPQERKGVDNRAPKRDHYPNQRRGGSRRGRKRRGRGRGRGERQRGGQKIEVINRGKSGW